MTKQSNENLPLWDGRRVCDVSTGEFAELLCRVNVLGADLGNSRAENVEAYAVYLDKLRRTFNVVGNGAAAALMAWAGEDAELARVALTRRTAPLGIELPPDFGAPVLNAEGARADH